MRIQFRALAICVLAAASAFSTATAQDETRLVALLGAREPLIAVFDSMPEERLEVAFLRCDQDSSQRVLDMGEAVLCAMTWDALLKREFGGDVDALLAWWRAHRGEAR